MHIQNNTGLLANLSRKTSAVYVAALLAVALLGSLASAQAQLYGFNLFVPNTAVNPATGATISVVGAGRFSDGSVVGQGTFTISSADAGVTARGTWRATGLKSWHSDGGFHGSQGGTLEIWITLFPKGGPPIPNQLMTIVCPFEEGVFDEDEDGTTVGDFTEVTGGFTVFHLIGKAE